MDKSKLVEIAVFSRVNDSAVAQSMLEDAEIPFFVRNQNIATLYMGALGGAGLIVKEEDVEKALDLLREGGFEEYFKKEFKNK